MVENNLNSQLWHAFAGGMIEMPGLNSKVFYFPQGHADHTFANVDFSGLPRVSPMILCRVAAVNYLADRETDEVYARIRLIPIGNNEPCLGMEEDDVVGSDSSVEKTASCAKILTQSDSNNGGGFSVPRYCAETLYPELDYEMNTPFQTIVVKDVHGEIWYFRHIYRGTPKRHLLTSNWSEFVNHKKLVAGDLVVFFKSENGDLSIGIRRAKRYGLLSGGGFDSPSGWNSRTNRSRRFPGLKKRSLRRFPGKIGVESVYEAVKLAANGEPFEVLYYPLAGTPEFLVKASSVNSAMQVNWCSGMRFKMPFETDDGSRISWFTGTISSVGFVDPILWPNSPWKLLQVIWDEPDLLQDVKFVNPWLVELVSSMPIIHMSTYLPPPKRQRIPQLPDFLVDGHFPMPPSFSGYPFSSSSSFYCLSDMNITTTVGGIQGARHTQIGVPLFPDIQFSNNLSLGLLNPSFGNLDRPRLDEIPDIRSAIRVDREDNNDVSCVLEKPKETNSVKTTQFLLFGQLILIDQESNQRCLGDSVSQVCNNKNSWCVTSLKSEERLDLEQRVDQETGFLGDHGINFDLDNDNSQCQVLLESEDVGRTLDLSVLGSYDELFNRLGDMVGLERSEMESCVFYCDSFGTLKQIGDDSFRVFVKTAKKLTISIGRK